MSRKQRGGSNDTMIIVDCPWCDGPVPIEAEVVRVRCDACRVVVELAADPASARDLVAAALRTAVPIAA